MQKRVFVGLSGGVDSAVSAARLKRGGFDVTGVFIKIWQPTFLECTWERDRLDAMRVAVALGIPFHEIDLSAEYEREVIAEMTRSYEAGITPNPDISCNEKIKFGAFFEWARASGADIVATGHYARIEHIDGEYALMRGVDSAKDQSYFLYRIERSALPHIAFPIGDLKKDAVRTLAYEWGIPVANKHDSQGLCFVGDVDLRDFLRRYIPVTEGPVVDARGTRIGVHDGAALYTIGQRHGFIIVAPEANKVPHYVIGINAKENTLVVSPERADCERLDVDLLHEHWLSNVTLPLESGAQSRYREQAFQVRVSGGAGRLTARFETPHIASHGQSLVLYEGDRCLGGAVIA